MKRTLALIAASSVALATAAQAAVPAIVDTTISELGTDASSMVSTKVLPAVALVAAAWIFIKLLKKGAGKIG